jgi:hypothetical protein
LSTGALLRCVPAEPRSIHARIWSSRQARLLSGCEERSARCPRGLPHRAPATLVTLRKARASNALLFRPRITFGWLTVDNHPRRGSGGMFSPSAPRILHVWWGACLSNSHHATTTGDGKLFARDNCGGGKRDRFAAPGSHRFQISCDACLLLACLAMFACSPGRGLSCGVVRARPMRRRSNRTGVQLLASAGNTWRDRGIQLRTSHSQSACKLLAFCLHMLVLRCFSCFLVSQSLHSNPIPPVLSCQRIFAETLCER